MANEIRTQHLEVSRAIALGDAFYGGHRLPWLDSRQLAQRFGASFAASLADLAPRVWSQPIASSYGQHIVRIEERRRGETPPLAELESEIARDLARMHGRAALDAEIRELRNAYDVALPQAAMKLAGREAAREFPPQPSARSAIGKNAAREERR